MFEKVVNDRCHHQGVERIFPGLVCSLERSHPRDTFALGKDNDISSASAPPDSLSDHAWST